MRVPYPNMKECPKCGNDALAVYVYDGWHHVECDECHYFGPGEGSAKEAIESHNSGIGYDPVAGTCVHR